MLPKRKYLVHKPVTADKIVKKARPGDRELLSWLAYHKYDGVSCIAVVRALSPEGVELYTREGNRITSAPHISEAISKFPNLDAGVVLFGELWCEGKDFHEISGAVRRKSETTDWLQLVVFDAVSLEDFERGYSPIPFDERLDHLLPYNFDSVVEGSPFWPAVCEGDLGDLGLTPQEAANQMKALGGRDGLILRDQFAPWQAGSGTYGGVIKVKPNIRVSYRVVDILRGEGEKTGREVFRLLVQSRDGKTHVVGSGVPHKEAELPDIGDIVEIEAMEFQPDGALREPRYKGIRDDVMEID